MRQFKHLCLLIVLTITACQQKFRVHDKSVVYYDLRHTDSYMLESNSTAYQHAQESVWKYCKENLIFPIDSTLIFHSCRVYKGLNPNASQGAKALHDKHTLKYQYFISFRTPLIRPYTLCFVLDKDFHVRYASRWITNIEVQKQIWKIRPFKDFKKKIKSYKNGWIKPIGIVDLEFNEYFQKFVYVVTQKFTNRIKLERDTPTSQVFTLNQLIVDPVSGEILIQLDQPGVLYDSDSQFTE